MAQIFHRSANSLARMSILGLLFVMATIGALLAELQRSPYVTRQYEQIVQTPPFSHQHHVGGMGIDCRFCHTSVEDSNFAGIPPTKTCMNCHAQIWTNAPMLEPVRESFRSGKSLTWTRVHDLPDFVYFDHSIHVNKGIGCKSCHGEVDNMPLMREEHSLQMEWCLSCHREPAKNLRPRSVQHDFKLAMDKIPDEDEDAAASNARLDQMAVVDAGTEDHSNVFSMQYEPPSRSKPVLARLSDGYHIFTSQKQMGEVLLKEYHIRSVRELTSCSTCHR